jgi:hypothetical protein
MATEVWKEVRTDLRWLALSRVPLTVDVGVADLKEVLLMLLLLLLLPRII